MDLITKVGNTLVTKKWDAEVQRALQRAKGNEKPQQLQRQIMELTFDRKMAAKLAIIARTQRRR